MKRVGIVGAGLMGGWHAARWRQLPVELVGVYDHTTSNRERWVSQFGGRAFGDMASLLEAVDIIDICTPTFAHKAGVLAAAEAGKPVICEKPIARTLTDARMMIDACERAGVALCIGQVVRFFPQYVAAKAALASGELGRPGVLRTIRAGTFPRPTPETWYNSFDKGGGVIMDLAIHDLDFARWCFGEVERVFARGLTFSGGSMRDHALITLRFQSGALAHIEGSWASPPSSFRTALELAGSEGLLEWDSLDPAPFHATLKATDDAAQKVPQSADNPLAAEDDPYYLELKHFLEVIDGRDALRVTPEDAYMALKLSLAAIESVRSGRAVTLADFEAEVQA